MKLTERVLRRQDEICGALLGLEAVCVRGKHKMTSLG